LDSGVAVLGMTNAIASLATATPAEIDTVLAEIWGRIASLQGVIVDTERAIREANKMARYGGLKRIPALEARIEEVQAKIAEIELEASPYEAEFARRGGWTRAFLVTNNGGHVHSSRNCSTCRWTTRFNWVIEFSGTTEAEVVDAAGERACTVCYPSAPVEVRSQPTRIFSEEEKAAAAARDEKAAAKAAKDADQVVDPESGKVLFKTERGATNEISSELGSALWYDNAKYAALAHKTVKAVAARRGVDSTELFIEFFTKAVKKHDATCKKVLKDWAAQGRVVTIENMQPGIIRYIEAQAH
jgi:hypothetical protein